MIEPASLLLSATEDDKWCRGVRTVYESAKPHFRNGELALKMYPGSHNFTKEMREVAYKFLDQHLKQE